MECCLYIQRCLYPCLGFLLLVCVTHLNGAVCCAYWSCRSCSSHSGKCAKFNICVSCWSNLACCVCGGPLKHTSRFCNSIHPIQQSTWCSEVEDSDASYCFPLQRDSTLKPRRLQSLGLHYHAPGSRARPRALVSLLLDNEQHQYIKGATVLAKSVLQYAPDYFNARLLFLLKGRNYAPEVLQQAQHAGWVLEWVSPIVPPHAPGSANTFDQFAKLHLWNLERFKQVRQVICMLLFTVIFLKTDCVGSFERALFKHGSCSYKCS